MEHDKLFELLDKLNTLYIGTIEYERLLDKIDKELDKHEQPINTTN